MSTENRLAGRHQTTAAVMMAVFVLMACQPKKATDTLDAAADTTQVNSHAVADTMVVSEEEVISDCVRSVPEPVLRKEIYPRAVFVLADSSTAKETTDLEDGDKLIIFHKGCEYYWLTFRFETSRFQADTTDTAYWLDKSLILMHALNKGLDEPLGISQGVDEASKWLKAKKPYALGEEIVYREGSIRSALTFDRIQKMDDTRYAVEISFFTGPL